MRHGITCMLFTQNLVKPVKFSMYYMQPVCYDIYVQSGEILITPYWKGTNSIFILALKTIKTCAQMDSIIIVDLQQVLWIRSTKTKSYVLSIWGGIKKVNLKLALMHQLSREHEWNLCLTV